MLETEDQVASALLNVEWGGRNPEQVALLASPQRHVLACLLSLLCVLSACSLLLNCHCPHCTQVFLSICRLVPGPLGTKIRGAHISPTAAFTHSLHTFFRVLK